MNKKPLPGEDLQDYIKRMLKDSDNLPKIVTSEAEFKKALDEKKQNIIIQGDIAEKIIKKRKSAKKKGVAVAGLGAAAMLVAGTLLAIPTGGTSIAAATASAFANITVAGTTTTIALSAAEVAMLCGTVATAVGCATAVIKDALKYYDIKVGKDEVLLTRKN